MNCRLQNDAGRGLLESPGGIRRPNPKPEARNPKQIRSPKLETTRSYATTGADSLAAPSPATLSPGNSPAPSLPIGRFGFRVSGFLRTSDLGLRISRARRAAFSLLEVMIACGIFFMAVFAILAMVSAVLRNARSLRRVELDAGMVAAQVTKTNRLTEGVESGDFGNLYPDYSWETEAYEAQTNGLWQVDIVVRRRGLQQPVDSMSILVYSPDSSNPIGPRPLRR